MGQSCDTGDDESVRATVSGLSEALGGVDILVNAAAMPGGVTPPPKLAEVTTDALWAGVNTKVMGYLRCAREVAPLMVAQGWGRIINVSGLAARQSGSILGSIRNVSVAAMTKNLADEVAYVVAFLASPKSVAISGDAIACGGGTRGAIHY